MGCPSRSVLTIPKWLLSDPNVSDYAKVVFATLDGLTEDATTIPPQHVIADRMGKSVDTLQRALRELCEVGAIRMEIRRRDDGIGTDYYLDGMVRVRQRAVPPQPVSGRTPGIVTPTDRMFVFDRDRLACFYCDDQLSVETATVDHVVPRLHGGSHDVENLVTACQPCNSSKNARRLPDEADVLAEVAARNEAARAEIERVAS